ncbi:hypothetical protein [Janthinobacterium sp. 17J80-10]|uniref:hypothetical protein n=1 Tax=Janthinobacterium sp. 17J80-10 TaxID=2497863 RepID=UPI0013E8C96B|nr:hypothetical protein [Janthinobacterium sp. 17J80-10]
MKNVLVILALVAVAGCSGMRPGSSSGSMGSDVSRSGTASRDIPMERYSVEPLHLP